MGKSYLVALGEFAFRKSYDGLDRLATIVGLAVPASYYLLDKPMPDSTGGQIAIFILCTLAAITFLRFLSAPYFVWKEQAAEITKLRAELGAAKIAPAKAIREHMSKREAEDLSRLLDIVLNIETEFWEVALTIKGDASALFYRDELAPALSAIAHHDHIVRLFQRYRDAMIFHSQAVKDKDYAPEKAAKWGTTVEAIESRYERANREHSSTFKELVAAIKFSED